MDAVQALNKAKQNIEEDIANWSGRHGRDAQMTTHGLKIALSAIIGLLNQAKAESGQTEGHEASVKRQLQARHKASLTEALSRGRSYEDGDEDDSLAQDEGVDIDISAPPRQPSARPGRTSTRPRQT